MKKKIITVFTAVCVMATAFSGCSKKDEGKLSGKVTLAGSTSMEKLCEAMSESFMSANSGVTVTVEYSGSGAGLESLA